MVKYYGTTDKGAQSCASGGRIHVCPQAYVSMHNGGHGADERRFYKLLTILGE